MKEEVESQLSRYLRDESSEGERQSLFSWAAKSEENATAFARSCVIESLTEELIEEGRLNLASEPASGRFFSWQSGLAVAATVALSAVGWFLWFSMDSNFAVVAQSVGARLPDGSLIEIDRQLGRESIEISGGLVRLDFEHGAAMTVEGPAKFELRDEMNVYLEEGVATFQVPESAKGFRVDTEDAEVIDLGTAFGLSRRAGEDTEVCVFEGEVEVEGQRIKAGEAVSARLGNELRESPFQTAVYENAWPVTSGVLQTTGMMRFVSPGPGFVPGKFEDDNHITVFLERREVITGGPVRIDLADPGEYRKLRRQAEGPVIPEGTAVRSYLLQLDPVGLLDKWDGDKPRVAGQITFDRPILGLIANGRKLLETDESLGHADGFYGSLPRGLEPPKQDFGNAESEGKDVVILAADRRTLILNIAAGSAVDQIRVLVEAE